MHNIAPHESGVFLRRPDGSWSFYPSRRKLFNALGWGVLRHCRIPGRGAEAQGWQTVVKDVDGRFLAADDFECFATAKTLRKFSSTAHPIGLGPVPGTGVLHRGTCFRYRVRTAQERRLHAFYDEELGEPKPRARRTGSNLPDARHDLTRSDYSVCNWKHFRKQQWKA